MPYTRRKTWPDNPDRQDFEIRCEGLGVGRVFFTRVPEGDRWLWTIYLTATSQRSMPISGQAVTLDQAAADFKRSYEAMRAKAGLPKPQR